MKKRCIKIDHRALNRWIIRYATEPVKMHINKPANRSRKLVSSGKCLKGALLSQSQDLNNVRFHENSEFYLDINIVLYVYILNEYL